MDFAIAKMSSKGQIVVPSALRKDFKSKEEFLMIKQDGTILIKKVSDLAQDLKEDLCFAKSVDKAWQEYEKGGYTSQNKDDFLTELEKW